MYYQLRFIYVFVCTTILVPILLILLKPLLKLFGITINWDTNAYLFIYWFSNDIAYVFLSSRRSKLSTCNLFWFNNNENVT